MNVFKELVNLPEQGIYALVNGRNKKVWISHSTNIVESLGRTITSLKDGSHTCKELVQDIETLRFDVLEEVQDKSQLKLRCQFWISDFESRRYSNYRNYSGIVYTVKTRIVDKYIYVYLKSKGRKLIDVGVFDNVNECDTFIADVYPKSSPITQIQYCKNELTQRLIKQ